MKKKVLVDDVWMFAGQVTLDGKLTFMFKHKYDGSYIMCEKVKWRVNSLGITLHFDNETIPHINVSESHMSKLLNGDPRLAVSLYSLLKVSEGIDQLKHVLKVNESNDSVDEYAEFGKQYKLEVI